MRLIAALTSIAAGMMIAAQKDWPTYGGDPGGQRFSTLDQINPGNVGRLKVAWSMRTGDVYEPRNSAPTRFQATPIYVDQTLYVSTPLGRVLALDPLTGKTRWTFDGHVNRDGGYGDFGGRGVASWKPEGGARRLYLATIDAHLFAIDAATGKPCMDFGDNGAVDLRAGLHLPPNHFGDYEETSPPAVVGDILVIGSAIADNGAAKQASGEVRGFDARTGALRWTWHPLGDKTQTGAANAWSVIAVDQARDLVFVPTGSASPDYFGGMRLGDNLYANSIVALKGKTGERVWHFQTIHHDLWDYDVADPPLLFDLERNGERIPAVAVGSKSASLFILNRENGKPLFPVEERAVPKSDVPGEQAAATQPFSVLPEPVSTQGISPEQAWGIDEADRTWCRNTIANLRTDGPFTPPSVRGTAMLPGFVGGMAWSGAAYDPLRRLLLVPANNLAVEVHLIPRDSFQSEYQSRARKLNGDWEFAPQQGTPFGMRRRVLLSPKGMPCNAPPWGTLRAISMDTGKALWQVPEGQLNPKLPEQFGSINLGGPIATASGLTFMAGALDPHIRAFETATGNLLWTGALPTSARATPMTFEGPDGRQYLIICAGGHKPAGDQPIGDYVVAFALPAE